MLAGGGFLFQEKTVATSRCRCSRNGTGSTEVELFSFLFIAFCARSVGEILANTLLCFSLDVVGTIAEYGLYCRVNVFFLILCFVSM